MNDDQSLKDIELKASLDFLEKHNIIIDTLKDNISVDHKLINNNKAFLKKIVESSDTNQVNQLMLEITKSVCKHDKNLGKIFDKILEERQEVKKSFDLDTAIKSIELLKISLESIAMLITILQTLGYLKLDEKLD